MKNMKKILAGITLGIMVMGAAALSMQSVEAFSGKHGDGEHRGYKQGYHTKYADMTDEQKAELNSRHEQRMQWYKKDLQIAVDAGKMTQQEADARLERMQSRFQDMQNGKIGMYGKSGHRDGKYNKDNKYSKGNHSYGNHNSDCLADCPR